jgi:hypothetical protein
MIVNASGWSGASSLGGEHVDIAGVNHKEAVAGPCQ